MNHYITTKNTLSEHCNNINIKLILSILFIILFISSPNAIGQDKKGFVQSISVKDKWFEAKGDGIADDTAAIQKAVDFVYKRGGGVINFPAGTYLVTSVNIREGITYQGYGATIKRPEPLTDKIGPKPAKGVRTFTNHKNPYAGQMDSRPLTIKGLTFDGSSQTQGPYHNYELEHSDCLFLSGSGISKSPGKLVALIEDCTFKNGVSDGIALHNNVRAKIYKCRAENVFRGGLVMGGRNLSVEVRDFTTSGKIDNTGVHLEDVYASYITFDNLKLLDGHFVVGVSEGSTVIGNNIISHAPFNLGAMKSTVKITNSEFGMGPNNKVYSPYNVTFDHCKFYATRKGATESTSIFTAAPVVAWNTARTSEKNQKLTFNNCIFTTGDDITPSDKVCGILTWFDNVDSNNVLTVDGGNFSDKLAVGIGMQSRGGNWIIRNATFDAALPLSMKGFQDSWGNHSTFNIALDSININSHNYIHVDSVRSPDSNRISHQNISIDESSNNITSIHGIQSIQYKGYRVIKGSNPPQVFTHGFIGDKFVLKGDKATQWECTTTGYDLIDKFGNVRTNIKSKWINSNK